MKGRCVFCQVEHEFPGSKRCAVVFLLDRWEEIHDPDVSRGRLGSGDSGGAMLPVMSRAPSVLQLGSLLVALRVADARVFSHLAGFHWAERRMFRWVEPRKRRGKVEQVDRAEVRRVVPSWVRMELVVRGQDVLVEGFGGDVMVPRDLWEALTLSSEEIEERERRRALGRLAA